MELHRDSEGLLYAMQSSCSMTAGSFTMSWMTLMPEFQKSRLEDLSPDGFKSRVTQHLCRMFVFPFLRMYCGRTMSLCPNAKRVIYRLLSNI